MLAQLRRTLVGSPLPTERMMHERLGKIQALAVLSSDALSSVAYATEEILLVLVLAGSGAFDLSQPIALAISTLLIIVATSYYQTVHAYPTGGGAYSVAKENLGTMPALIAAGALLTDYVLTVAVSVSAGVAAITSALPALFPVRVEIALLAVAVVTIVNLRGLRESGRIFAVPTYFFVGTIILLIGTGVFRILMGTPPGAPTPAVPQTLTQGVTIALILRAFASGCTALTGVEAISNGVTVFKRPESDNAGKTLLWMVAILVTMFLGITFLAHQIGVVPKEGETVVSQIARAVFGSGPFYYAIQAGTALILLLAANTSYSDFPRLANLVARDRYLPRQLANIGDRLVYSNGILLLGGLASILIVVFGAETHALIPLYAVGVFISFTLSQSGMVRHWLTLREGAWVRSAIINGIGATATGIVMLVVAGTKFLQGAWIVLLLIGALIYMFRTIHTHYVEMEEELSLEGKWPPAVKRHTVIIPVADLHRGVIKAVRYGQRLDGDLHVVTVAVNQESADALQARWPDVLPDVPLEILPSPYRSVVAPLIEHISGFVEEEGDYVTIIVPEFVPTKRWHNLLHNQTAFLLRYALLYARHDWKGRYRIITEVPFYLNR